MAKHWEIYEFDERGEKHLSSIETNWRLVEDRRNVEVREITVDVLTVVIDVIEAQIKMFGNFVPRLD